jgi:hypothetical protein
MGNKVELDVADIAKAIERAVIARHATPGALHPDDGADEMGVQTSYGRTEDGEVLIRFVFVTAGDCLIQVAVDAEQYVRNPQQSTLRLHNSITDALEKHMQARSPLILSSHIGRRH